MQYFWCSFYFFRAKGHFLHWHGCPWPGLSETCKWLGDEHSIWMPSKHLRAPAATFSWALTCLCWPLWSTWNIVCLKQPGAADPLALGSFETCPSLALLTTATSTLSQGCRTVLNKQKALRGWAEQGSRRLEMRALSQQWELNHGGKHPALPLEAVALSILCPGYVLAEEQNSFLARGFRSITFICKWMEYCRAETSFRVKPSIFGSLVSLTLVCLPVLKVYKTMGFDSAVVQSINHKKQRGLMFDSCIMAGETKKFQRGAKIPWAVISTRARPMSSWHSPTAFLVIFSFSVWRKVSVFCFAVAC